MSSHFTIESPAVPQQATCVGFRVREVMSEPFTMEVAVRTEGAPIDRDTAIGRALTLSAQSPPSSPLDPIPPPHVWNGVIASVELLHEEGDLAFWCVVVVPKLWALKSSFHSRIFTVGTVPEIVEAVLLDEGLASDDFRFELRGSYPSLEHVCAFRESSFDFVSRLLEREGITYFFEHDGDKHVMVLVDDMSAHMASRPPVPMEPLADDDMLTREGFFDFSYEHRALPSEVLVTDYDYLRPSATIEAGAAIQRRQTGVVVEHAEFVPLPNEERRYADLRAEEILSREQWFTGRGRAAGLRAGFTFELKGHGLARLDDSYLVVELESEGFQIGIGEGSTGIWLARLMKLQARHGITVAVGAIPASVQFRPMRTTPWPRIHGVVDGIADGMASSDYAQIDAQGRYKVRLRFDESDLLDGQASTWIRMLQPHGGSVEGFHFPLRKGTEVQVAFLGGDPDRPVIVGAAPNALERSKVRKPNLTQNVIHTGGDNTITMEDVAGGMYVTNFSPPGASTLHLGTGPNQMDLRTDGQGHLHIGMNLDVDVHGNKIEHVTQTLRETYGGAQTLTVTGLVERTMETSLAQTVQGPVTEHVTGAFTETVTKSVTETYNAGQKTTASAGVKQTFHSTLTQTVNAAAMTEDISSSRFRMVSSTMTDVVSGHTEETFGSTFRLVGGDYTEDVGASYTLTTPKLQIVCVERNWIDTAHGILGGVREHLSMLTEWLGGTKISATGASITVAGVNLEQAKLSVSLTGVSRSAIGYELEADLVEMRKHGLVVRKRGLEVVTTGIYIII